LEEQDKITNKKGRFERLTNFKPPALPGVFDSPATIDRYISEYRNLDKKKKKCIKSAWSIEAHIVIFLYTVRNKK
jgi:hypothetical protein